MRDRVDAGAVHACRRQRRRTAAGGAANRCGSTAIRQGRRAGDDVLAGNARRRSAACVRPTGSRTTSSSSTRDRVEQALSWLALPAARAAVVRQPLFRGGRHRGARLRPRLARARDRGAHLDDALGELVAGVHRLGLDDRTTIVVVSDHGMTPISYDRVIYLDAFIDLSTVDVIEYRQQSAVEPARRRRRRRCIAGCMGSIPSWRSTGGRTCRSACIFSDNVRIPAIVGVPADGWTVTSGQRLVQEELHAAAHGYEPTTPDMGALFVAAGPSLRRGVVVDAVRKCTCLRSALPDPGAHACDERRQRRRHAGFPPIRARMSHTSSCYPVESGRHT